jgi:hypothetical protein
MNIMNIQETIVKDVLHNLDSKSGASDEYCKGLIVGLVGGLMAADHSFEQSLRMVHRLKPATTRDVFPETWPKGV